MGSHCDPMLIFRPPKNPSYSDWITLHLFLVHEFHPKEAVCQNRKKVIWQILRKWTLKLNFFFFFFKFKILQKWKKNYIYILPRNIPTDFEKNPNNLVTELQVYAPRQ